MFSETSKAGANAMRRMNLALLAVACLVMFLMLKGIDWPLLGAVVQSGMRFWPLLLLPYAGTCLCWTVSWRLVLSGSPGCPPLWRLFLVRLGGESLNQLTPTASLGGEPYKAQRLHALGVNWTDTGASLLVHKALMVASLVLYILVSLALLPYALPGLPRELAWFSALGTLGLGTAALCFCWLQWRNPCSALLRLLVRLGLCPAALRAREAELAQLDATLSAFYRKHWPVALLALACYFLGWLLHAIELILFFRLLGHPVDPGLALCLDALAQLVAGLGFMIPVSLGVQDGGNILLSLGFNLGSTLGAGFSILRRFREACWLLVGLLVAARDR
jgi:glycosyltransferase 2 family protein